MLRQQNNLLKENSNLMRELVNAKKQQLTNSLTALAAGYVGHQDNLASFNPLFTSNLYAPLTINYTLLQYLYKTHGILQTMIDEPVLDAFRDGLDLQSKQLDAEDLGELEDFFEENGVWETVKATLIWARLFGGAALVVNSGQDPDEPLDLKDIARGRLEFYDADRWECTGTKGRHSEKFQFHGITLDASRAFTIAGKRAPYIIRNQLSGWGMSEIERAVEDFNLFLRGRNVLYEILDEAKVDVYKMEGYRNALMSDGGTETVRQRIQATNSIKNFHNALLLDKEDEYEVRTYTFAGLADVMKENRIGIASALRMPMTKIFGISAAGFNSGEDDIENYNAMVMSQVREPARPLIRKVLQLGMLAVYGKEYDISFKFKPLRVIGAVEEESIKASKSTRILAWYDKQLIDSKEAAEWAHKEGLIPVETAALRGELAPHPVTETAEDLFSDEEREPMGKDPLTARDAREPKETKDPKDESKTKSTDAKDVPDQKRRPVANRTELR